jgi:hypothetical protein
MSTPAAQPQAPAIAPVAPKLTDLEIKDAQLIFGSVWQRWRKNTAGKTCASPRRSSCSAVRRAPAKAPIRRSSLNARGLTCPPVVISALLDSPEGQGGSRTPATWSVTARSSDCSCAAAAPRISRRRHPRRLSAHQGAGRMSQAAGPACTACAANSTTPAQHPFPAADDAHHGAVRGRKGIRRPPAQARPRGQTPQRRGPPLRRRRPCWRNAPPTTTKASPAAATGSSRSRPGMPCNR